MGQQAVAAKFKEIENYSPAQLKEFIQSQGVPYHPGYICAETTTAVLKSQGISVPNSNTLASSYKDFGAAVDPSNAKVGDVVYFTPYSAGTTGHVGVITGFNADGTAVVHSGNGTEVDVTNVNLATNPKVGSIRDGSSFGGANGEEGGSGPGAGPGAGSDAKKGAGGAGAGGTICGSAGCGGGGMSPASLLGGAGILGNLGGLAQSGLMQGALGALNGAGLQGIMGSVMGAASGALGNALGAVSGQLSGALSGALGGALGSLGLGSLGGALSSFAGKALGGSLGALVAGQNPLQALSSSAFGALSQMGAGLIPGLSNVMPAGLAQAAVNGLSGVLGQVASGRSPNISMALAGGLSGLISSVTNNMIGNSTISSAVGAVAAGALTGQLQASNSTGGGKVDLGKFANLIGIASAVTSDNRNMVGSIAEAAAVKFGNGTGGYGAKTRNMQDAMTFCITTMGQDVNSLSADLIALGEWDAKNLMRLMQPGNVAIQILNKGIGDLIGLTDACYAYNVPISGLDNPVFDRVALGVLNTITDHNALELVKTTFNMTTNITNLSDLCNFQLMMPTSFANMPATNFREFGIHLASIGINGKLTLKDIGFALSKVETGTDLNHISQITQPFPPEIANSMMQLYGYGGGALGEQTMADVIGTPAGYVHTDTIPVITSTNNFIMKHSAAATLVTLTNLLNNTLAGQYTHIGSPGNGDDIPDDPSYIEIPLPSGTQRFNTLDDAIHNFIPLVEAEHQALLNSTDPALQDSIKRLNTAWNASCAQIIKENNNLIAHNIDLFDTTPTTPSVAMGFAQNLEQWGLQTGYGQPGHYIERVASDDIYGDSIKFVMRQARNAAALEGLGVDIEQYRLPRSQFFREPERFYQTLYTGNMPATPETTKAIIYPRTPTDVYLTNRKQVLDDKGFTDDVPLLNNQKDEIYYDSHWDETDPATLTNIGRRIVRNIINNNITVEFPNIFLSDNTGRNLPGVTANTGTGTNGIGNRTITRGTVNKAKIAEIHPTGLLLPNNDFLIPALMNLANTAIYGDLPTTKYSNPFNTDQMIYGVLELLSQVNFGNIDALINTPTGGTIAGNLLKTLKTIFQQGSAGHIPGFNINAFMPGQDGRSLYDTNMDRNDPAAWGGTGPDTIPNPTIKN